MVLGPALVMTRSAACIRAGISVAKPKTRVGISQDTASSFLVNFSFLPATITS